MLKIRGGGDGGNGFSRTEFDGGDALDRLSRSHRRHERRVRDEAEENVRVDVDEAERAVDGRGPHRLVVAQVDSFHGGEGDHAAGLSGLCGCDGALAGETVAEDEGMGGSC